MNKLIEFLPPEIANIKEFKEIMETEDKEFELLEKGQQRIFNENFIDTTTEYGIKKYETLFKIRVDDLNESLDFRKLRIKNRKLDKVPFSYSFLSNKLKNLFGEDNYKLELLNNEYILKVEINTFDWNTFNEIIDNFRYIIPCNMVLNSTLVQKIKSPIYYASCVTAGEEITLYPYSAKTLETKAKLNIALSNNSDVEEITIHPRREAI